MNATAKTAAKKLNATAEVAKKSNKCNGRYDSNFGDSIGFNYYTGKSMQ